MGFWMTRRRCVVTAAVFLTLLLVVAGAVDALLRSRRADLFVSEAARLSTARTVWVFENLSGSEVIEDGPSGEVFRTLWAFGGLGRMNAHRPGATVLVASNDEAAAIHQFVATGRSALRDGRTVYELERSSAR
jgi:hypothetical protein